MTRENLIDATDNEWEDAYKKKMGEASYRKYANSLYTYLTNLDDYQTIEISKIVKPENEDLFAKLVCRFFYLGAFNGCFSSDYQRLTKFPLTKKI